MEFTAAQIAEYLKGTVEGDPQVVVTRFNKIEEGEPGGISFLANPKYTHYIYESNASVILVNKDFQPEKPIRATLIRVEDAYACLAKLMKMSLAYRPKKAKVDRRACVARSAKKGRNLFVGAFAYVGENAVIGDNCQIYPQVYIGDNVSLGNDCILYPGVKIYHDCIIGDRCIIHAGAVIGADGFGFAPQPDGSYDKIPQTGNVVVEDDVEIGANTTIDRSTMGSTRICKGTKLDNLIQIAHNVVVGENTVMAAQCGIAGSTKIGPRCMLGGQVGVVGHLNIPADTKFYAQTGVTNDPEPSKIPYFGTPAQNSKQVFRSIVYSKQLPALIERVKQLEKELDEWKKKNPDTEA